MITPTERNKITKVILTTQDEDVIRKIESIIFPEQVSKSKKGRKEEKESLLDWNEIPDKIKKSIEIGLKQAKAGQTLSHKEVMKKYKKWLKK
ncbi:MAG TPA: hypothetical protein VK808_08145 [Bacteroidia bacterium]|nr:hypothetical protein [Bacteroidia bacterium]